MQISKLYETKLECSSYNVTIDSTDTTVTLTLVDFNGSPVTNTDVTLKADKGYFTKAVGKTTTTYTDASATKTINATTDNNGKVVATWTASEWGLCMFSANNNTTTVSVKYNNGGVKKIYDSNGIIIYVQDNMFRLSYNNNINIAVNDTWVTKTTLDNFLPDTVYSVVTNLKDVIARLNGNGQIQIYNTRSTAYSDVNLIFTIVGWIKI